MELLGSKLSPFIKLMIRQAAGLLLSLGQTFVDSTENDYDNEAYDVLKIAVEKLLKYLG
jgi:hypothetical protein